MSARTIPARALGAARSAHADAHDAADAVHHGGLTCPGVERRAVLVYLAHEEVALPVRSIGAGLGRIGREDVDALAVEERESLRAGRACSHVAIEAARPTGAAVADARQRVR